MKIAMLTDYWKSPRGGGINTYITGLVDKLNEVSNEVEIKVIFVDGAGNNNYKISGAIILSIIESLFALIKLKPDVIHVHESWPLLVGGAIYRKLHKNIRLVYTFHTEPKKPMSLAKRIKKQLKKYPHQWALNQCDCITFVSNDLRRKIETISGFKIKTETAIIYAGVEKKKVSNDEIMLVKKRFGLNKADIIILAQAMTANKAKAEGTKILMSSIRLLKSRYPTIKLLITRNGLYRGELEDYANKIGITNSVIFTGDIDNPNIALKVADIFCQVTLGGGLSIALLEAMVMGTPILSVKAGGIEEAITNGENGIILSTDQESIMKGIIKLIEDKNFAATLGNAAKKSAENKFNWGIATKKFLNIYRFREIAKNGKKT